MNLEDRVDNYLRMYIQKDIPITREQADEINEYKCELKNRIDKAIEYIENAQTLDYGTTKEFNIKEFPFVQHILAILKGESE